MSLIPATSDLDRDLADLTADILAGAAALHHAAATLHARHARFWSVPTDRLLAVLNADIARTLAVFQANTAMATAINAQLDALALPEFATRAPTTVGREDIVYDPQLGRFIAVPDAPTEE
jgi:hypothetical protein